MDTGAWQAIGHRVTPSQTRLKGLSKHHENYTKKASNRQTFKEPKWVLKILNERSNSEHVVQFSSVSSVPQSCPILCDPMNRSTPGLPVHHQLPEFIQTHVHRVSDAIQPSHPLSSPSPPAPNPSQHQSLFQWVNSLHEVAKVLR